MQNNNIPKLHGAIALSVAHEFFRRNQLMNLASNETHLKFNVLALIVAFGLYVEEFRTLVKEVIASLVACAKLEPCRRVVVNLRCPSIHQPLKDFIDRRNNLFPTAKVLRQIYTAIGIHLVLEVRRVDEPEPINRLLNVADEEQIIAA